MTVTQFAPPGVTKGYADATYSAAGHDHDADYAAATHAHAASDVTSGTLDNARVNWASPSAIGTVTPADGTFDDVTADTVVLVEAAAPGTPAAGQVVVYAKTDGKVYIKDDGGTETDLTATGSGGISADGWVAAGETWTYASADDPTFTFTISGDVTTKYSAGMRVKLTQTTAKYFIITKVAYGDPNTTVTVYGGTDYDLANASITDPYYSVVKAPYGFPLDPDKWTVEVTDTTQRSQASPSANTWYNLGSVSISVPIGAWNLSYSVTYGGTRSTGTGMEEYVTLSTANNSESDTELTSYFYIAVNNGAGSDHRIPAQAHKNLAVATKTSYYLNVKHTAGSGTITIYFYNSSVPCVLRAICAYL